MRSRARRVGIATVMLLAVVGAAYAASVLKRQRMRVTGQDPDDTTIPRITIKSSAPPQNGMPVKASWTYDLNGVKTDLCTNSFTLAKWREWTGMVSSMEATDNLESHYVVNAVDMHVQTSTTSGNPPTTTNTTHHVKISKTSDGRAQWWEDGLPYTPNCDQAGEACNLSKEFCSDWVEALSGSIQWDIYY